MPEPLKIVHVSSEIEGLAKTGGLADVVRALPDTLQKAGHEVIVVIPCYGSIPEWWKYPRVFDTLGVPMGNCEIWCAARKADLDGLTVYLIEHDIYFNRPRFYDDGEYEYLDNAARFGFFSKAVFQLCKALNFKPDVIHSHDWQTGMVPFYLKEFERYHALFTKTVSVHSIHNAAFQGKFDGSNGAFLGIAPHHFRIDGVEDYGMVNYLKAGVHWADKVTAVSKGYREELLTIPGSHGMNDCFWRRQHDFTGIVNGCDYQQWNPEIDPLIPAQFTPEDMSGKAKNKAELQKAMGLPVNPDVPLLGVVSRLTGQKGFEMLIPALYSVLQWDVQVAVLGTGEKWIVDSFHHQSFWFPDKLKFRNEYSNYMAHLIEAGSDCFLMPSVYEPCGLNQLYSLKYGTVPIVRAVGGLRDTVQNYDQATGAGTGFVFTDMTAQALANTIGWAVNTYYERPQHFKQLQLQGMRKNYSWENSCKEYLALYKAALVRIGVFK